MKLRVRKNLGVNPMKSQFRRCGSAVLLFVCTLYPSVSAACPACSVESVQRCHLAELIKLYDRGLRKEPGPINLEQVHLVHPARLPLLLDWYRERLRRSIV